MVVVDGVNCDCDCAMIVAGVNNIREGVNEVMATETGSGTGLTVEAETGEIDGMTVEDGIAAISSSHTVAVWISDIGSPSKMVKAAEYGRQKREKQK